MPYYLLATLYSVFQYSNSPWGLHAEVAFNPDRSEPKKNATKAQM